MGREPTAIQRALHLLETVAQLGPGATGRAIAAHADVPPATAYRLLNLLVGEGYLVRVDELAGFALGRRARELARQVDRTEIPDPEAVVDELRQRTRHGVHLVAFADRHPVWVSPDPDHEAAADEMMLHAWHASAIGKLLLAYHPDLLTGDQLVRCTAFTTTEWPVLLSLLAEVRRAGVAFDREEAVLGRVGVAAAIRSADGHVAGCLCVTGNSTRLRPDDPDLLELVRSGADRLVGWEPLVATVAPAPDDQPYWPGGVRSSTR